MQITPLGDQALMVELGDSINESTHRRVQAAWRALSVEKLPGVSEAVPAYTSVTLFYDPWQVVQAGAPDQDVVALGRGVLVQLGEPLGAQDAPEAPLAAQ